jgi:uncharacterized protein (TIGR00369 family)
VTIANAIGHARAAGQPGSLVAAIPYARFLGIDMAIVDGELISTMRFAPHLIGNPMMPALHGGTLGALLECTAIVKLLWEARSSAVPKTVNVTVEFLRPGRPQDTHARAEVTRLGRRIANVRAQAWQSDARRPIALASAHFLLADDEGTVGGSVRP